MSYSPDSFVADEQPTTAKWNKLWSNDASFNDGSGIADNAIINRHLAANNITNLKMSSTNWEYRRAAPGGNVDTTGTSFVDAITFTDLNIPTWATQVVFHWAGSAYPITSVTDGAAQLLLGTGDNTDDERIGYNSYPINTVYPMAATSVVALTGTGVQSLKLQIRELAGAGAIRVQTSSVWTVLAKYY